MTAGLGPIGYDGLGGHHKIDIFPKPKPRPPLASQLSKKSEVIDKQKLNFKKYFENTFDDSF